MDSSAIKKWKSLSSSALRGGIAANLDRQAAAGKKTARERLRLLLDPESFHEIDQLATSPLLSSKEYTDGVITGLGTIEGRRVAIFSQDFTIKGGSLGKRHAEKICKVMDHAAKIGCPIIGILDSGGARIDEGIHALTGYGQIFMRNTRYSGVVPQISLILGPCAGGAVYSPALTDFIFMTEHISQMFITGPQVIKQVLHQTISKEELGGSDIHATQSGVAHVVTPSEEDCFIKVKQLLSYLPNNYLDKSQPNAAKIPFHDSIESLIPENVNQAYDMKLIVNAICDEQSFFELQAHFATNIITGFARLNGQTVGIVANQPAAKAGTIDINASCKAARFISTCNNFNIPIISLVDVPGFLPGIDQEHNGIIRHGAKLLYAYAHATVPKITLILRKAYGGAYIVMGSKGLGADFCFAWPQAQIAVLGAQAAITILHGKHLQTLSDDEQQNARLKLEEDYTNEVLNPFTAAEYGYIDAIIEPSQTRENLIKALSFTQSKVEHLPQKKSGNIPL